MVISDNSRALQWEPKELIIWKIDGLFAVRPSFGIGQSQSQAQEFRNHNSGSMQTWSHPAVRRLSRIADSMDTKTSDTKTSCPSEREEWDRS